MSREIKFRAWDKETGTMHPVQHLLYGARRLRSVGYESSLDSHLPEDIELLQFTGLKDRNGVDIYEGDTILVNGGQTTNMGYPDAPHESIERVGEVRFAGGSFFIGGVIGDWPSTNDTEVIGNIYEHGELLK